MNLLSELKAAPKAAELEAWLHSQFSSGADHGDGTVIYTTERHSGILSVNYHKDGSVISAIASKEFPEEEFHTLRAELETEFGNSSGARKIFRTVLFSGNRLQGRYRHSDTFQILPVPKDAPVATFLSAPHPFLIELSEFETQSHWLKSFRRAQALRETSSLLNLFISGGVTCLKSVRHHWVISSIPTSRCELLQEGYFINSTGELSDFSNDETIPSVPFSEQENYYSLKGGNSFGALTLPSDFDALLDGFGRLNAEKRATFLRACFWFQHARFCRWDSVSASHVALISAVEAIAPKSKKSLCRECNRPWATDSFAQAVETYLPNARFDKASRDRLYGMRSSISHGRTLYVSDVEVMGFSPVRNRQMTDELQLWDLVRLMLRNWLLMQGE